MIVRIRDLISAVMLFPLALSGFFLGFGTANIVQSILGRSKTSLSDILIFAAIGSVPLIYWGVTKLTDAKNRETKYFGELSRKTFVTLVYLHF